MSDLLLRATTKAGLSEDDPLYAVVAAQSEMIEGFLARVPGTNGNQSASGSGVSPGQLKYPQLEAIGTSIKSLPNRADLQAFQAGLLKAIQDGGGENKELTAFLDEWRVNKAQHGSKKAAVRYWLIHIAVIAAIAAVVFAAGYFSCWISIHAAADARVDRVINTEPSEIHTLLLLKSHGGSLDRETIAKGPEQGIVLRHGDLHEPWISADSSKAVVIPLQSTTAR